MPTPKPPPSWSYRNLRGQPLEVDRSLDQRVRDAVREAEAAAQAAGLPAADVETVFDALCLAGWQRGKTAHTTLLRCLGWRTADGRQFTPADVSAALSRLGAAQRVEAAEGEGWRVPRALALPRLAELLRRPALHEAWKIWAWASGPATGPAPPPHVSAELRTQAEAAAFLRLLLASGIDVGTFDTVLMRLSYRAVEPTALRAALEDVLAMSLVDRVDPALWWQLIVTLHGGGALPSWSPLVAWADAAIDACGQPDVAGLRIRLAVARLHRGRLDSVASALGHDEPALAWLPLLQAAMLARAGRLDEAAPAFAAELKALGALLGRRKGVVPYGLMQWYLLALLHRPDPTSWQQARKVCVAESGSRDPSPHDPWGRWAHACAVRLGDARPEASAFSPPRSRIEGGDAVVHADQVVLAAWCGHTPTGWTAAALQAVSDALHAAGWGWKADLLLQACVRLGLPEPARPADAGPPWPVAWFGAPADAWRDALAAITALGDTGGARADSAAPVQTLRWQLHLDAAGRPQQLVALEPTATGRGKPKVLTPLQLKKRTRLEPHDAAVARAVRASRWRATDVDFDLVPAVQALVGHPALELGDAPGVRVDLRDSLPVLHVLRQRPAAGGGEVFVFRLQDELLAPEPPEIDHHAPDHDQIDAERQRRDGLRVVRDAPERARLLRITPAQRRVAELTAKRWAVPVDAQAELDAALRVLAGHFQLHSDAAAGEPVPAESRLVAQLQPRGDALQLQLAVRPFGDFGPLLPPGAGRAQLLTVHGGLSLATERALDTERAHLHAVLAELPFLGDAPDDAVWLLDDPEQALAAVHALGRLVAASAADAAPAAADAAAAPAGAAQGPLRAIEWPRGQPLRVHEAGAGAFAGTLRSNRGWFELRGELRVDEGRVLSLQALLQLLREAPGRRFIALGKGQYLALADQLRQRLAELDALSEADGDAQRIGTAGAAWLADAAADLALAGDKAWRDRARRLEQAAEAEPAVPPGLQAALRPYQQQGYVWMMRLAEAGFGAVLADDMGLGKTVQTLAVLLARAAQGPALVVAPTSVCDNWADEALRFAPGLQATVYGRGTAERAGLAGAAGPGDVVVVSYALLLRDADVFTARPWATLVLDEAQALKNAATQRARATERVEAGFRLALTGTPVENRLADLWSLMNLLNPGLLGSAGRFAERFANPIERQRSDAVRGRLRRLVAPFLLRRTKAQVLGELPPRTEMVRFVEPEADELAFLEALRRTAAERVQRLDPADGRNAFNVLAELTRLRRAACDPRLVAPELAAVGAKAQAFERLAVELADAGHQALVFSQFTDFLRILAERLDAAGLKHLVLDGSTPAAARAERVAAFQRGEAPIFLISLKAGGFGLNLTAADYVVIADPWWNPAAEDQAMGRAHRMGQKRPVTVYRLVTRGSIEERIVALHQDKRDLAEGLLEGQDSGAPLAAAELIDLLRDAAAPTP